jgi:hypothetical protein
MIDIIRDWFVKLFTEPPSSVLNLLILYAGAFIAIIGGLYRGGKFMCNRLWPSRPKATWYAGAIPAPSDSDIHGHTDSEVDSAWRKDRLRWSQGRTMRVGDWYQLYLEKPRALSEIIVKSQGSRFPKEFIFSSAVTKNDMWEQEVQTSITLNLNDQPIFFKYRFKKHKKIIGVRFVIVTPTLEPLNDDGHSPAWAIYDIDFKEYRLFGCLWESPIK